MAVFGETAAIRFNAVLWWFLNQRYFLTGPALVPLMAAQPPRMGVPTLSARL